MRTALPLVALFGAMAVQAGSYGPQTFNHPNNTTGSSLGDGSVVASSNGVASVQNGALRLTRSGTGDTLSSYKLPDLDPGAAIQSFTVSFDLRMDSSGSPADGWSLNFGEIAADNGGGENGYPMVGGLTIAFDTWNNGGDDPSIEVFANGISVGNFPQSFPMDTTWRAVAIHWDNQGLDITYAGSAVATNLPVPGFTPAPGNRFAYSARTGGATQDTFLDDVSVSTSPAAPPNTGGAILSEFMAENADTLEDEEMESPDWIEIYNGTGSTISLDGWHLTNDAALPAKWTFPAVTVPPFGHLLVYASSKDRRDPAKPLHTSFNISKEGGYLALVEPDGTTIATEFAYDPQVADVSYGLLGEALTPGYLETPTPGAENTGLQAAGPPAEEVVFSRPGGIFNAPSVSVSISQPVAPGAVVRYTLDNSVPHAASPVYSQPLTFNATGTVRARVFAPDQLPGPVSSRTFLKLAPDLANYRGTGKPFESNIPIVVLDSFGTRIDSLPKGRPFRFTYGVTIDTDPASGVASITGAADFQGRGGTHVRGQTSAGFPQKPYAWEIWNNEDEDKDESILGFPAESDWILQTNYNDKALMRNLLAYQLMYDQRGSAGAVRTRFVEVFFNQDGDNQIGWEDYAGVYIFMERIKRGNDRIDIEKLTGKVTDPELITGGYVFKKDKEPEKADWTFTTSRGQLLQSVEPEDANSVQVNWLRNYVNQFESALYGGNFTDPESGYRAFVEADTFIDNHLAVEIAKQIDGYRLSTYYTKPRYGRITALPIWDYNLSFGNADYLQGWMPNGWYYPQLGSSDYPWYPRLFQDPDFVVAYWDRYWEIRRGIYAADTVLGRIDAYRDELTNDDPTPVRNGAGGVPTVENPAGRHFARWPRLGIYDWPNPPGYAQRTTYQSEVEWMKDWLRDRLEWIDDQYAKPPAFSQYGGIVTSGYPLTITDPNAGGGSIFYTLDGTDPRPSGGSGTTSVLLPELAAGAEILAPSAANGGSALTVAQWTMPAAPPNAASWTTGATMGVGFDSGADFGPYINTDVKAIMQPPGGPFSASLYVRVPFSLSEAQVDGADTLKLRIRYDDGFVAYLNGVEIARALAPANPAWDSVATGSRADTTVVQFAEFDASAGLAALQPGVNILALHGMNTTTGGSDLLLSAQLEATSLVDGEVHLYTGPVVLDDSVTVRSRSFSGDQWSPITSGTFLIDAVPAGADHVVVSEMMYHPPDPTPEELALGFNDANDFEYIELRNISDQTVSLAGVRFVDGIAFAFDDGAPELIPVPPGGRVVVVENIDAFRHRYSAFLTDARIAGVFTGNLNNAGETVTLHDRNGQPIKSFTYDDAPPWPTAADGAGYSLVLNAPQSNPDHGLAGSWRASATIHGSPGADDGVTFSGDPSADSDGNGASDLLEFAAGTNPLDPASRPTEEAGIAEFDVEGATDTYFTFRFRQNLAAADVAQSVETSHDLLTWMTGEEAAVLVSQEHHGDGTATLTYRGALPLDTDAQPSLFIRRRVVWTP